MPLRVRVARKASGQGAAPQELHLREARSTDPVEGFRRMAQEPRHADRAARREGASNKATTSRTDLISQIPLSLPSARKTEEELR